MEPIDTDDIRPAIGLKSEPIVDVPPACLPEFGYIEYCNYPPVIPVFPPLVRRRRSAKDYDEHREEIIADWLEVGTGEMRRQWGMSRGVWVYLKRRWGLLDA